MAKLKPRARIIRTIGDQLISGPEAAIIELVKNSFDADSNRVEVRFNRDVSGEISLCIKDYGHGMTYAEVVDHWLEPATDIKVRHSSSRSGLRKVLGAKGIGRFAVSRLGKVSLMTSIAKINEHEFDKSSLLIDWSQFSADKYLDEIELDIDHELLAPPRESGVEIEISSLRDIWSQAQVERLIIELRRLAYPHGDDVFEIFLDISCFEKDIDGFCGVDVFNEHNADVLESDDCKDTPNKIKPFYVGGVADYRLEGEFNRNGNFSGTFQILRGDSTVQVLEVAPPHLSEDEGECGCVRLKLNIFDREQEAIESLFERMNLRFEKIGIRKARRILTDMSGISISRNGFRIRPYGSSEHDWLGLQARRVQDPSKKLGSDQVSGFVEIGPEDSSGIIERSSREGLEINPQFRRLRALIENLLPHLEERRFKFREKAGLSRRPVSNINRARDAAKLQATTRALNKIPEEHRVKVMEAMERDMTALSEMLQEVDNYQKALQSRASLGLVVAEVVHEGRRLLDPMLTSIKTLKADSPHAFEESKLGEIYRKYFPANIEMLLKGGQGLSRLFKKLDPVSGRKRGRPVDFNLHGVIDDALSLLGGSILDAGIRVDISCGPNVYCYGYKEDMQASLLNIIENAVHWLGSVDYERIIEIVVIEKRSSIEISVNNNGPEVLEDYRDRIFDAGFSLKSDGTGLGLAIARETCRASQGDLKLGEHAEMTSFVIEFPKATI